jgi:hypothetical protein
MNLAKSNILVVGLLSTGSSAIIDLLREYDNLNIILNEFNDFRAPGLVADQLCAGQNFEFPNRINKLTKFKSKIKSIYYILPFFKWELSTIIGVRGRVKSTANRIKQLNLLKKLNTRLSRNISIEEKISFANEWIREIGNINGRNKEYIVFDQPLLTVLDTNTWKQVFDPCKLIIVFRDPKDQLAEIIRNGKLYAPYGGPDMNLGSVTLETIYGRNRNGAINLHIEAIKKRFEWIDQLKKELNQDEFLLVDFEGLVNNYEKYKTVIENFIGNINSHHNNNQLFFNPMNAKKSIGIYNEYLIENEIDSLNELENWYSNMISKNQIAN